MFTHILLASDGSECALRAAAVAATFAKKFDARLTIVSVYHPSTLLNPLGELHGLRGLDLIETRQDEALCAAGRIVDGRGVAYRPHREIGHPVERIVHAAGQMQADLIVLGSRGLGDFGSFLLGSVSDGVLHHAHCPVLIVRGGGGMPGRTCFPTSCWPLTDRTARSRPPALPPRSPGSSPPA